MTQSKSDAMNKVARGLARETFEHSDEGWFDITGMRDFALEGMATNKVEIIEIPLSQILGHIMTNRVVCPVRVTQLSLASGAEPGIMVYYPADDTHLMIDGHHRAIRRNMEGERWMTFFLFTEAQIIRPDMSLFDTSKNNDWGDKVIDPITKQIRDRVGDERG